VIAARPVLVLAEMILLVEAEGAAPDDLATDEAATAPDVSGAVTLGVDD